MKLFWLIIGLLAIATAVVCLPKGSETKTALVSDVAEPASLEKPVVTDSQPVNTERVTQSVAAEESAKDRQESFEARADSDEDELASAFEEDEAEDVPSRQGQQGGGMSIERRADGSIRLDDRFTVRGSGTDKDPYRISWELLVSAEDTYAPSQDMFEMPPRIEFLNGKHVQIHGFLFTAMLRDETSELLVMRNMWDGCCVGLPPSSYDAIEVNLRKPLWIKSRGLLESGILRGVLHVDPYVKDGWLLGLYVMDDGVIDFGEM